MALSPYEKRSFYRFMAIYLAAGFLVVAAFSMLFYRLDSRSIEERIFSALRLKAMKISASAVDAQMRGTRFEIPKDVGCEYQLIGRGGKIVGGCIKERADIARNSYVQNGCAWVVDRSARGHMGIEAVAVRDCSLRREIVRCGRDVATMAVTAYGFLVFVGWYLGRLFLRPMREKLEAMERFIKDSTHELNTPVTTMLLALRKIEQKEYRKDYLNALQMSGRLIARVYEDLTFLLLQPGSAPDENIREVDLAKKVHESVDFFSILSRRKNLSVTMHLEPCRVTADPHHIELLVKNLIDNAIKYTPSGGSVSVILERCTLEITDSGCGIPKEKLQTIFERFHRENSVEGGFGIGLSIVDSIAKIYGYAVEVNSRPGEGSTFRVRFRG